MKKAFTAIGYSSDNLVTQISTALATIGQQMGGLRNESATAEDFSVVQMEGSREVILTNAGSISHEVAMALANKEYEKYRVIQDKSYISDFDKEIKRITEREDDD